MTLRLRRRRNKLILLEPGFKPATFQLDSSALSLTIQPCRDGNQCQMYLVTLVAGVTAREILLFHTTDTLPV